MPYGIQFDPAVGLLYPGGPQTRNSSLFAVPQGLVGYWGLDPDCLDFTNGLAFDLSGRGNNGTLTKLPASAIRVGLVGTSLNFNGVIGTNSPSIQLASAIITGTTFTIAQWIQPASPVNTFGNLFTEGGVQGIWFNSSKIDWFYSGADHRNNTAIIIGVWTHWSITCNSGAVVFYINGAPDGAAVSGVSFAARNIGADGIAGAETFTGNIDDIRIYNRALDPWEITALYQAGLAGRRNGLFGAGSQALAAGAL